MKHPASFIRKWLLAFLLAPLCSSAQQSLPGLNGPVYAIKSYVTTYSCQNGSQSCCQYSVLIVGGQFTMAGGVAVNNVAIWNGSKWLPMGTGVNGAVRAIEAVQRFPGDTQPTIYVGGDFTDKGAYIAKWDGANWSGLGSGVNSSKAGDFQTGFATVRAIKNINGLIYVGGRFTTTGTLTNRNIAIWNPSSSSWQGIGSGMDFCNGTANTVVGVGSLVTMVNAILPTTPLTVGLSSNGVTPSPWSTDPADYEGLFTFDGTYWHGHCVRPVVTSLGGDPNSVLYVGGTPVSSSPWTEVGYSTWEETSGADSGVFQIAGGFELLGGGGAPAQPPAGSSPWWPVVANPPPSGWKTGGTVNAIAQYQGEYYFGGSFDAVSGAYPGQQIADYNGNQNVIGWNGSSWSKLQNAANTCYAGGIGVDGPIYAMDVSYNACQTQLTGVWVAGNFNNAGGMPASKIAFWDGSHWHPLGVTAPQVVINDIEQAILDQPMPGGGYMALPGLFVGAGVCDALASIVSIDYYTNGVLQYHDVNNPPTAGFWQPPALGTYTLTAMATDANGLTGISAPVQYTVTTAYPAPATPTSLAATIGPSTHVNLTWADSASDRAGFRIQRSLDGANWTEIADVNYYTTSYTDSTTTPYTTYYYRVCAFNYGSNSAYTTAASILTPAYSILNLDFAGGPASAKSGFAATGIKTNDYWNSYDAQGDYTDALPNLRLSDGSTSSVGVNLQNARFPYTDVATDPMYHTYAFSYESNILVSVTNLPAGAYDFYLYGHGNATNQNSAFTLIASTNYGTQATTTASTWSQAQWQVGVQYVVFTNVVVATNGQPVSISSQLGSSGYAVINGMQIAARTQAIPSLTIPALVNVDFAGGTTSAKNGFAAIGKSNSDFWNSYNAVGNLTDSLTNLKYSDGTSSGISVTLQNTQFPYTDVATDPMYHTYAFSYSGTISVVVGGLSPGTYEFFLYGHGNANNQNSSFSLSCGASYGTQSTTTDPSWSSSIWEEGRQFVVFRSVTVSSGQSATITVPLGSSGYAVINGMQIVATQLQNPQ